MESVMEQTTDTMSKSKQHRRWFTFEKSKVWLWSFVRFVLVTGISFIILYPIFMKISIAFKDKIDIYNSTVVWIPQNWTLENFQLVFKVMDYPKVMTSSILVSGAVMILQAASCALAGYGFAKLRFWGSGVLFALVIFTILVPPQTIMIPTYMIFKEFDLFGIISLIKGKPISLIDTYWPFFLTAVTGAGLKTGLYVYIFRQFFRGLPREIEEAALVDGAGVFKTFTRIMLPNAIPALVTVMLFSFVWQWNDTYYTSLFLNNANLISIKLQTVGASITSYLQIAAGVTANTGQADPFYLSMLINTCMLLTIAPLIILYLFVQRHFVESVERTGLVG